MEKLGASLICVGHEKFGEGSDSDRSFEAGHYFSGPVYVNEGKELYSALFQRKGLLSGFGIFDMSKERMKQVKERGTTGNLKGDGFQLGGTIVLQPDGTVKLFHQQKYYGDDATNEDILEALRSCDGLNPPAATAAAGEGGVAAAAGGAGAEAPAAAAAPAAAVAAETAPAPAEAAATEAATATATTSA